MTDDAELLRRYANDRSETDFAELVRRHTDLVYCTSLRQMGGDHHRAQEVTQMVFTDLARKASALVRHPVLQAWLHRSSHLAALSLQRKEARRKQYEKSAALDTSAVGLNEEVFEWDLVAPVLDKAINSLEEKDRQVIILRFFGNRAFREIGLRLKLSENGARMRLERALAKLNDRMARHGITSSTGALAAALSSHSITAAPAGVAFSTASAALAANVLGPGTWIAFMSTAKLPASLTASILIGGTAFIGLQMQALHRNSAELDNVSTENRGIKPLAAQNSALESSASETLNLQSDSSDLGALQRQVSDLLAKADAHNALAAAQRRAGRRLGPEATQEAIDNPAPKDFKMPKALVQIRPEYPGDMKSAGVAGEVTVDFLIGKDGLVYNAHVVSSTDQAFEESALNSVNQWVFQPGQSNGESVYSHMRIPIVYTPTAEAAAPTPLTWF